MHATMILWLTDRTDVVVLKLLPHQFHQLVWLGTMFFWLCLTQNANKNTRFKQREEWKFVPFWFCCCHCYQMRRVSCRLLLFRSCLVRKIHSEREQNSEEKKKTEHNFARIHKLHNGRSVGFEKLLFFVVCEEELPMATNAMHTHTDASFSCRGYRADETFNLYIRFGWN